MLRLLFLALLSISWRPADAAAIAEIAEAAAELEAEYRLYAPPPAEDDTPGRLLAEKKPKRKFCNTTTYALKGDYAYEACGAFCKAAKAVNHCKCACGRH